MFFLTHFALGISFVVSKPVILSPGDIGAVADALLLELLHQFLKLFKVCLRHIKYIYAVYSLVAQWYSYQNVIEHKVKSKLH